MSKLIYFMGLIALMSGCSTTRYVTRDDLGPALHGLKFKEYNEAGTEGEESGMPGYHDRLTHTCTSAPIYDLYGYYIRTSVVCR